MTSTYKTTLTPKPFSRSSLQVQTSSFQTSLPQLRKARFQLTYTTMHAPVTFRDLLTTFPSQHTFPRLFTILTMLKNILDETRGLEVEWDVEKGLFWESPEIPYREGSSEMLIPLFIDKE